MSILSSFSDWLFTDTSKTQTFAEAQANYNSLQKQLDAQGGSSAGGPLQDPGAAADSAALNSLTFGVLGTADPNADPNASTGVGSLVTDLIVLAAIGAAIWLFIELGGINQIKKLAS